MEIRQESTPFGGVLAPAGLFAAPSPCAEPLPGVPFPTDVPNLPPVPAAHPVAFLLEMIRERCPSEFILSGIQTIPVWGFWVSRGSTGTALVGCCGRAEPSRASPASSPQPQQGDALLALASGSDLCPGPSLKLFLSLYFESFLQNTSLR